MSDTEALAGWGWGCIGYREGGPTDGQWCRVHLCSDTVNAVTCVRTLALLAGSGSVPVALPSAALPSCPLPTRRLPACPPPSLPLPRSCLRLPFTHHRRPAYLEASDVRAAAFYAKHGFKQLSLVQPNEGGPVVTIMARMPQPVPFGADGQGDATPATN